MVEHIHFLLKRLKHSILFYGLVIKICKELQRDIKRSRITQTSGALRAADSYQDIIIVLLKDIFILYFSNWSWQVMFDHLLLEENEAKPLTNAL